jgi:hypothetical protein
MMKLTAIIVFALGPVQRDALIRLGSGGYNSREWFEIFQKVRAPRRLIQRVERMNVKELATAPPDLDTVVDTETGRQGRSENVSATGGPGARARIRGPVLCQLIVDL